MSAENKEPLIKSLTLLSFLLISWGLSFAQERGNLHPLDSYNNPLDRKKITTPSAGLARFNKGIELPDSEFIECERRIHNSTLKIKQDFVSKIVESEKSRAIVNGFTPAAFTNEEQSTLLLIESELEKSCSQFASDFLYDEVKNRSYYGLLDTINAYKRYFEEAPELINAHLQLSSEQPYGTSTLQDVVTQYPHSVVFLDTGIDPAITTRANILNVIAPIPGLALDGENNSDKYWPLVDHGTKVVMSYDVAIKELLASNPSLTIKNQLIPVNFFSFYDFFDRLYFDTLSPTYMKYTSNSLNQLFAANVRIVNFSGAIDRDVEEFYRLFENYPNVIWVVAAGNQGVNIDDPDNQKNYPLRPQVYLGRDGKRFENIINVTISHYDAEEKKSYVSENYGSKFVDIAVEGWIRGTSFAAPVLTACIVALLEKSTSNLTAKEIKALLINHATRMASVPDNETEKIPILDCQKSLDSI